ncbi:hypothetical protein [Shewanella sp. GXUN23E]|uniref:hypothetical protein n=1 Tax=Shewanella sp. GXUN23E TaxID=3422498 RepID=UPI003D7E9E16
MAEHELTDTQTQEIRRLYLHRAKELPPPALDAEILALSRQHMSQQVPVQKPSKHGLSPWVWSSAASVLIITGLSLYWPELKGPSSPVPGMSAPEPVMMRSVGSEQAIEVSLSPPPGMATIEVAAPAKQADSMAAKRMQPMAADEVGLTERADTLRRIEAYLAQGERDKALALYQSTADKFMALADDNPEKSRFLQLGRHLGVAGTQ